MGRIPKKIHEQDDFPRLINTVIVLLILTGIILRIWRADEMLIFADEIHTIKSAVAHNLSYLITHYSESNTCMPLTLYEKLLLKTVGLSELTIRLPIIISGSLIVVITGFGTRLVFSNVESIIISGVISLSPYLVFLSRQARPYEIITLFFSLAAVFMFFWARGKNLIYLWVSAVLSALLIFIHPVLAPAVFILGVYPIFLFVFKKIPQSRFKEYLSAACIFIVLTLIFVALSMANLLHQFGMVGGKGTADLDTMRHGLMLLLGLPVVLPLWFWGCLATVGAFSAFRRFPSEIICLIFITLVQIAALFIIQPIYMEVPWVWFRYMGHLHVFFCIMIACGTAWVLHPMLKVRFLRLPVHMGIIILFSVFCGYHLIYHHYSVQSPDAYNTHPMILYLPDKLDFSEFQNTTSNFYNDFLGNLPKGGLVEAPMLLTLPLYGIYQKWHGRRIYAASLGNGYGQDVLRHPGICFQNTGSLNNADFLETVDARFLIIHKRIKEEMAGAYQVLKQDPFMATQIDSMKWLFKDDALEDLFGKDEMKITDSGLAQVQPVYEDRLISVYDISMIKSQI